MTGIKNVLKHFRPRLSYVLVLCMTAPVFTGLGFWQLDRARQNRALHEQLLQHESSPVVDIDKQISEGLYDPSSLAWRQVRVRGHFVPNIHILLDSQIHHGQAGYHVFTPFRLRQMPDHFILVNRGWVFAGMDRRFAPALGRRPTGHELQLFGTFKPFPFSGIRLREQAPELIDKGVYRVHRLLREEWQQRLDIDLSTQVLRLGPESPFGYTRVWRLPNSVAGRNIGYAVQFFAIAIAALVLFIVLSVQRGKSLGPQ